MSEVELHLIHARLTGGLWEAARRGELRTHLPIGFEHDREGRIVELANESVQETISLVFAKFAEFGSARHVTAYLVEQQVPLPHRWANEDVISRRRAGFDAVHPILTNPTYAGLYSYGRSKCEAAWTRRAGCRKRQVPLPPNEWAVLIPEHTMKVSSHSRHSRPTSSACATTGERREERPPGAALLQGLVRCGRCGCRLLVSYGGKHG